MDGVQELDVAIVGAGPAGIGCGVVLSDLGLEKFALLERYEVGASFERWPAEMRLITPSFPSNSFGPMDLNSIAPDTSPAFTLKAEHPTGRQYAEYLRAVADHYNLPINSGIDVQSVRPGGPGFELQTSKGTLYSRFLIWAAGEFQYPRLNTFPGAYLCRHNSLVSSWAGLPGDEYVVIGGYESGIDAAVHLAAAGKRVLVLDARSTWDSNTSEPSVDLSPFTRERLARAQQTGLVELVGAARVARVQRVGDSFEVYDGEDRCWSSANPPILALGFKSSLTLVEDLFDWDRSGNVLLTESDESTLMPGLFLSGAQVRHDELIFCFIYKFRQRFAVIANEIAERLAVDTAPLDYYRQVGMFLDDLSCCGQECSCG